MIDKHATRLRDLQIFYTQLDLLEEKIGGKRLLTEPGLSQLLPNRGVYFFFEPGECRSGSGQGMRVVRVGTHAVSQGSRTTLWNRLRNHRGFLNGSMPEGGNHRGSIFRLHVGTALINRDRWPVEAAAHWGKNASAPREIREKEYPLEKAVSETIRAMPFLFIEVGDPASASSLRGAIERNSIALLSRCREIDPPSRTWLGHWADREAIRRSGLWNVKYIGEDYDPAFLELLKGLVAAQPCL